MVSDKVKQIPGILLPGTSDVLWKSLPSPINQIASCWNRRKIKGKQLKLACNFFHFNKNEFFFLSTKKDAVISMAQKWIFKFLQWRCSNWCLQCYYVEVIDQNTEHNTQVQSDTLYFEFLLHCIYKMSGIEGNFICKSTKCIILLEDVDLGNTA